MPSTLRAVALLTTLLLAGSCFADVRVHTALTGEGFHRYDLVVCLSVNVNA